MGKIELLVILGSAKLIWIYKYWLAYFNKHWDWEQKIKVCSLSPLKDSIDERINHFVIEEKHWSNVLIQYLKKYCTSEYLIITFEDFMLLQTPNYKKIFELVNRMEKDNIALIRTHADRFIADAIVKNDRKLYKDLIYVDKNSFYPFTVQAPIIRKDLLLAVLREGESVWESERRGRQRIRSIKCKTFIYVDEILYNYVEVMRQGIYKSEERKKYLDCVDNGFVPTGFLPEHKADYMKFWYSNLVENNNANSK